MGYMMGRGAKRVGFENKSLFIVDLPIFEQGHHSVEVEVRWRSSRRGPVLKLQILGEDVLQSELGRHLPRLFLSLQTLVLPPFHFKHLRLREVLNVEE